MPVSKLKLFLQPIMVILSALPSGIAVFYNDRLVQSTERFKSITGYSEEFSHDLKLKTFIPEKHYHQVESALQAESSDFYPTKIRDKIDTAYGMKVPCEIAIFKLNLNSKELIVLDVRSDVKNASLNESVNLIERAIDQAEDGFVITDLDGNIEFVNDGFVQLTGFSKEEALGKNPRILKSGSTPTETFEKLWMTILQGKTWKSEVINKKKDGTLFESELVISPYFDENGKLIKFIGLHRDMTVKNKVRRELQFLEKLSTVGELAPRIAHEMNNRLMVISGRAKLLKGFIFGDNSHYNSLVEEIDLMRDQIKNLMDLGSPHKYQLAENYLSEIIEYSITSIQRTGLTKHIEISRNYPENEPCIKSDFHSVVQVMNNLIINACHAMNGEGRLDVGISVKSDVVRAYIHDTGCGIPNDKLNSVFDPFFTTKEEGKGTGLGLSISKQIINAHNGEIKVVSKVGKGTSFFIEFKKAVE